MSLAYFEWSANPDADLDDPQTWADANPALGRRVTYEACESERETLRSTPEVFGLERCGIVDDPQASGVFPKGHWDTLKDATSEIIGPVAWAVDMPPDRSRAVILAVGWSQRAALIRQKTEAGDEVEVELQRVHFEVVDQQLGTTWVVPRMKQMRERLLEQDPEAQFCWVIAPNTPAGSLIKDAEDAGLEILKPTPTEVAQTCGTVHDEILNGRVVHFGTTELAAAVAGVKKRTRVEGDFIWDRRHPGVDISPLYGATYGRWGLQTMPEPTGDGEFFSWDALENLASPPKPEGDDGAAEPDDAG